MKKMITLIILSTFLKANNLSHVEQLKNNIITKTPNVICQKEQMYIECYDITINDCKVFVDLFVKSCYKQFEQKMIDSKSLSEKAKIGNKVGQCTGMIYDMVLRKANKVNDTCLKQPKWKK
jgi:hypothetical protein